MAGQEIQILKKDIEIMSESINNLKAEMKAHREDTAIRHKEFQDFKEELFEKLEKRFAGKWTEKVLIFIWSGIGIALIWALMTLIVKK